MKNPSAHTRPAVSRLGTWLSFIVLVFALSAGAAEGPPEFMTYQGYLVDGAGDPLGVDEQGDSRPENYDVLFEIYGEQSGGDDLWNETQNVTVDKGYFSVLLGEGGGGDLSPVFSDANASDRYIQISVKGIDAQDSTLYVPILPRLRMVASPYAFLARHAREAKSLVSPNGVSLVTAADGALTVNGTITGGGTIPVGGIIMWSGSIANIPSGWKLCDGDNGTPDLRGRFVAGAGSGSYGVNVTGGKDTVVLSTTQLPSHYHSVDPPSTFSGYGGSHSHNYNREESYRAGDCGSCANYHLAAPYPDQSSATSSSGNHRHATDIGEFDSATAGSGLAHENRPAFLALAYIMRVQ